MVKPVRRPISSADQRRKNDAWLKFYAGALDRTVPPHLLSNLPPKRERIRRPVDGKPAGPTEHQEQSRVISWWALQHQRFGLPVFALFCVPNGGARDVITGARLKAEGVRPGVPDLCLAVPRGAHHGLYIEMKVGDNKPSDRQTEIIEYLNRVGYKAVVHYSSEDAIKEIEGYLA